MANSDTYLAPQNVVFIDSNVPDIQPSLPPSDTAALHLSAPDCLVSTSAFSNAADQTKTLAHTEERAPGGGLYVGRLVIGSDKLSSQPQHLHT